MIASLLDAAKQVLTPDATGDQFQATCSADAAQLRQLDEFADYTGELQALTAAAAGLKDTMTKAHVADLWDNVEEKLKVDVQLNELTIEGFAPGLEEYSGAAKTGWFLRFWVILMWLRRLFFSFQGAGVF